MGKVEFFHLKWRIDLLSGVISHMASWKILYKYRFLAGKMIHKWRIDRLQKIGKVRLHLQKSKSVPHFTCGFEAVGLYCLVSYYIISYYIILYHIVLYYVILYFFFYIMLYYIILYCIIFCFIILYFKYIYII